METINQERDGRFLKLMEDFLSYKTEMASQNVKIHDQLAKLNDQLTLGHNIVDLEGSKANGKGILGSALGSSTGDPKFQGQTSFNDKVITESQLRPPKLSFPKFDGTDPKIWIGKCDRFFIMHPVPPDQKVIIASIHFEKKA
ncbi:hypothetical protein Dsin_005188 [Dipteronia sinensis]|uniref:Uncharacterized protein n=1 Tax=Dipteronia sinensis TaxID=43782 RepID=A0AAE0AVY6_9ROSI|nr:hypothetical protein Dsin_005188 [Dipteronia sinensis]